MKLGELFEYGVAINFFGNYRSEIASLNNFVTEFSRGLFSLRSLLIGGSLTAGLAVFGNALFSFGKTLEGYFASIKAIVGTQDKTLEALRFASKEAAATPFSLGEVTEAIQRMTQFGFAKTAEMRKQTFDAVGDFAGNFNMGFARSMDMVAKASFGNWESMADATGIRKTTIESMLQTNQKFLAADQATRAHMSQLAKFIATGQTGTEKYKQSLVELLGFMNKGGMESKLQTVSGVLSNLGDVYERFMTSLVGYSQVEGSFFNAVRTTLNNIYNKFNETSSVFDKLASQADGQMTVQERLGRLAENVGRVLSEVWRWIGGYMESATSGVISYLMEIDRFMNDFPNKVAPLILFLYLIKLQVEDFFSGFIQGFSAVWSVFWGIAKLLMGALMAIFSLLTGNGLTSIKSFGGALGVLLAAMLGFKMVTILIGPFMALWNVINMLRAAWTAWGAAALMNPMTWIILGVIALIAAIVLLIVYWDEVVAWVKEFWNAFTEKYPIVAQIFEYIKQALIFVWDILKGYVLWVFGIWKSVITFIWNGLKTIWDSLKAGWNVLKEFGGALLDWLLSPLDFIVKKALAFWDTLKGVWDWIAGSDEMQNLDGGNIDVNHNGMTPMGQSVIQPLEYQPTNYRDLYQVPVGAQGGNTNNNYDAENKYNIQRIDITVPKGTTFDAEAFKRGLNSDINRKGKQ